MNWMRGFRFSQLVPVPGILDWSARRGGGCLAEPGRLGRRGRVPRIEAMPSGRVATSSSNLSGRAERPAERDTCRRVWQVPSIRISATRLAAGLVDFQQQVQRPVVARRDLESTQDVGLRFLTLTGGE